MHGFEYRGLYLITARLISLQWPSDPWFVLNGGGF